jgi:DNA repair exonuclease SbcCD ATPase subunit
MQNKDLIIIALIVAAIYLYYQNRKLQLLPKTAETSFTEFSYNSDSEEEVPFPSRQKLQFELDEAKKEIKKLKESKEVSEEVEELETERDEAVRDKKTAEQESLSLGNKLKLKNQEVTNKEKEIERLKKEKSDSEISLNKKLKELKEKYSKQGILLDEEQLENNKLVEKVEKLEEKLKALEKIKGVPDS